MRATPITNFKVDKLHYDYVETVRRNIVNYGLLKVSAAGETRRWRGLPSPADDNDRGTQSNYCEINFQRLCRITGKNRRSRHN